MESPSNTERLIRIHKALDIRDHAQDIKKIVSIYYRLLVSTASHGTDIISLNFRREQLKAGPMVSV